MAVPQGARFQTATKLQDECSADVSEREIWVRQMWFMISLSKLLCAFEVKARQARAYYGWSVLLDSFCGEWPRSCSSGSLDTRM